MNGWKEEARETEKKGSKKDAESEMLVFAYWQAPISWRDLEIEVFAALWVWG